MTKVRCRKCTASLCGTAKMLGRPISAKFCILFNFVFVGLQWRNAVAQWLRCCATNQKVAGSIPAGVIGIFHLHKILPIALWSRGRLSLEQKWVPGTFSGGKGGQCVRLTTLPLSCTVVMKSGSLISLEPSGLLQACNGTVYFYVSGLQYVWTASECRIQFQTVCHICHAA